MAKSRLDAAAIAAVERRLSPAQRERVGQLRTKLGLSRIQFWNVWLGSGWGGWTTDAAEKAVWLAALNHWRALTSEAEADAVEAELGRLDAVHDMPEMISEPPVQQQANPARIDDRALLFEMRRLIETKVSSGAYNAARRLVGKAQRSKEGVENRSVILRLRNKYVRWEKAGFPDDPRCY